MAKGKKIIGGLILIMILASVAIFFLPRPTSVEMSHPSEPPVVVNEEASPTQQPSDHQQKESVMVIMEIEAGNYKGHIEIELYPDKAPQSVANFLKYVDEGFYDNTIFHRVIDNFMVQGGGFTQDMQQKETHPPIQNEASNGLRNEVGTLAMARTNVVDSATSQFFINVNNNEFLNHRDKSPAGYGYAVFGKVVSGMEVVNHIKGLPTGNQGYYSDVPKQTVFIRSAKRKL